MKNSPELYDLQEKVAQFIEYWGFKGVEGRIWLNIYISKKPLCAEDLMDRLGISKGLVSISIARLLEYNVLEKEESAGRTQYYIANSDLVSVITNVLRVRERKMMSEVKASAELLEKVSLKKDSGVDTKRVAIIKEMTEKAEGLLDLLVFDRSDKNPYLNF